MMKPNFLILVCRYILCGTIGFGLVVSAANLLIDNDPFVDVIVPFLQLQALGIGVITVLVLFSVMIESIADKITKRR